MALSELANGGARNYTVYSICSSNSVCYHPQFSASAGVGEVLECFPTDMGTYCIVILVKVAQNSKKMPIHNMVKKSVRKSFHSVLPKLASRWGRDHVMDSNHTQYGLCLPLLASSGKHSMKICIFSCCFFNWRVLDYGYRGS